MQTDKTKDIFYLFIILIIILGFVCSCNPVKQVLRDNDKMIEVWEKGALSGWCANDSVFVNKSDTLINFDTLYALDLKVDTIFQNDIKTVVKHEVKTVVKTVTIKDTLKTIVVDNSRITKLQEIIEKQNVIIENRGGAGVRQPARLG